MRAEHSVTFCDVFCEQGVFSVEQSERLLKAARSQRFKLKLHADEIVSFGGAELASVAYLRYRHQTPGTFGDDRDFASAYRFLAK